MPEWMTPIVAWLYENWKLLALIGTWGGIVLVWFRRRAEWRAKSFLDQVNFSLNYVESGRLCLRTLMEDSARNVWLNDFGVGLVLRAAQRTTIGQPLISLSADDDMSHVKRAVLNALSEKFAAGFLARALGAPVVKDRFVFAITCERYGAIRTHKLRVLLMKRADLAALFDANGNLSAAVQVAESSHADRLTTLKIIHRLMHSDRPADQRMIGEVELALPAATARAGAA